MSFDVEAFLAAAEASGQARDQRKGRGDIIALPADMIEPWRALVAASMSREKVYPVPDALIPPAIAGEVAEGNRATELGRTLRAAFSHPDAEGGDGTVVWVSVLGADSEKGLPMRFKATDRVSTKSTAYKRLLEAGKVDNEGRFKS